ncbi:MAG TPA: PEGA domain-containing protein, partial [Kofleriaceae bacterium]|nr:PEGA domain-containing protein [Kofleriaceae bacterium]
ARDVAALALAFDAACAWGAQAGAVARCLAARLASFGLAVPDAAIAPDIEAVIGDAIVAAGNAKPRALAVRGEPGARLAVDGKPAACALPCTVDLVPGDHVLAVTADGFTDATREVRIPDTPDHPLDVTIAQAPASPALAAAQWRARAGRGLPSTDAVGARLIAQLGGERRIAVLHAGAPLTGALVIDGALAASATARPGDRAGLVRELAYDAGVLRRPTVWQRPWFWIAVSGVALGVAAAITAITYQPTEHTSLHL